MICSMDGEAQFECLSKPASVGWDKIDGSFSQAPELDPNLVTDILRKVSAKLLQDFPLMPLYLFDRAFERQAETVNDLFRLRIQHAQNTTVGTYPSGDHRGAYVGSSDIVPSCTRSSSRTPILEPPTKNFPAIFECTVCFKTTLFKQHGDWTRHVYADVMPFFCIFYSCHSTKRFTSKRDWLKHQSEKCQKKYWRCDHHQCTTLSVDQEDFKTHLIEQHTFPADDDHVQKCGQIFDWGDKTCLFCGLDGLGDLNDHLAWHMIAITKYVVQIFMQQEITPQPIIDPIEQGEANQKNSTFPSIQSHPPATSQYDTAGTVPIETVPIPPQQPFTTECEQLDGWLLYPLGGSSNQHLQSQDPLYGGTSALISLPGPAPCSYNGISILPNNGDLGPECDSGITHHFAATSSSMGLNPAPSPETQTFPYGQETSSHIQDRDESISMSSLPSEKSEAYLTANL